jgi:PleD family two-component response regulator
VLTSKTQSDCKELCKKIIKLDSTIKFVGLINDKGRYVTGATKKETKFLVSKKDREMLFMEVALRTRMRREFDAQMGPVNFSLSHRKKVVIMSIPFGNDFLYISAEPEFDFCRTPFCIGL